MTQATPKAPKLFSRFQKPGTPVLFGGEKVYTQGREDIISREATQAARAALTGKFKTDPLEDDLVGIDARGFRRKSSNEIIMSDRQMESMSEQMRQAAKQEARARMLAQRNGTHHSNLEELPTLHKAQKVTFEGRTVKLHLGSRGSAGRNIVALPKMSQSEGSSVRIAGGVTQLELRLDKDGKQDVSTAPEGMIAGAKNLSLQVCFSDQTENLRNKDIQR